MYVCMHYTMHLWIYLLKNEYTNLCRRSFLRGFLVFSFSILRCIFNNLEVMECLRLCVY